VIASQVGRDDSSRVTRKRHRSREDDRCGNDQQHGSQDQDPWDRSVFNTIPGTTKIFTAPHVDSVNTYTAEGRVHMCEHAAFNPAHHDYA
jgi:hypothetical protein